MESNQLSRVNSQKELLYRNITKPKFVRRSTIELLPHSASNVATRADELGRSLVCHQERLTRYIQSYLTMVLGLTKCPLFLATLDPGPGNRSLLSLGLRKFPKLRDNQTSVGLHNHALVTPRGFEPAITGVRGRSPKPLEDGAIWSGR